MTDAPPMGEHQWCDAWLLVAAGLACSQRPASLRDVIAAADGIQHAVPEFDELDGGLARLVAAQLLHRIDGGFALTSQGSGLLAQHPGAWLHQQKAIEKALGAAPWSSRYVPRDAARGTLPPVIGMDEYEVAIDAYVRA